MEGVTTAIVLFVIVCVLFPRLVANRTQYYAAFACILLVILIDASTAVFNAVEPGSSYGRFAYAAIAVLQITSLLLLFLSAGGLTVRGLSREMMSAFEVIRRGETEKEIIIPIGNQQKERKPRYSPGEPGERVDLVDEGGGEVYPVRRPAAQPPAPEKKDEGPLPMD